MWGSDWFTRCCAERIWFGMSRGQRHRCIIPFSKLVEKYRDCQSPYQSTWHVIHISLTCPCSPQSPGFHGTPHSAQIEDSPLPPLTGFATSEGPPLMFVGFMMKFILLCPRIQHDQSNKYLVQKQLPYQHHIHNIYIYNMYIYIYNYIHIIPFFGSYIAIKSYFRQHFRMPRGSGRARDWGHSALETRWCAWRARPATTTRAILLPENSRKMTCGDTWRHRTSRPNQKKPCFLDLHHDFRGGFPLDPLPFWLENDLHDQTNQQQLVATKSSHKVRRVPSDLVWISARNSVTCRSAMDPWSDGFLQVWGTKK